MKFGSELNDRSILKWKNYNIDYNELKKVIKLATTNFDDNKRNHDSSSSLSSSETHVTENTIFTTNISLNTPLNKKQKKLLKNLYQTFKDQIEFVSLFVDSKYGEISRRVVTLKRQINLFIKNDTMDATNDESEMLNRLKSRKLLLFQKNLHSISKDLQDLSRFILLQKIAIKKLFKKFIKHSNYIHKKDLVDKITSKFLTNNPNSFINLELNDLSQELNLLYDFLDNYKHGKSDDDVNNLDDIDNKLRKSSVFTLDSLQLSIKNSLNFSNIYSKSSTFDLVSQKKGTRSITFWVHDDNLAEIKFLLSNEFKLITDNSALIDENNNNSDKHTSHRSSFVKLKNTKSSVNLKEDLQKLKNQNVDKSDPVSEEVFSNDNDNEHHISDENSFHPETSVMSIWLNNLDNPLMVSKTKISGDFDNKNTFKSDPFSQVLSSDLKQPNNPLLISPIGGLRQFTVATINQQIINSLFNHKSNVSNEERKKNVIELWQRSALIGSQKMAQLSFDWCIDNKIDSLAKIKYNRLRYINLNPKTEKIDCYISLDSNIKTTIKDLLSLNNNNDDFVGDDFQHSILELRFDCATKFLPLKIQNLINSHLVYQVDQLNFSLNNYLWCKYYPDNVPDNCMLEFIEPWFDDLQSSDIRKLPELQRGNQVEERDDENNENQTKNQGILLNKDEVPATNKGYWNEFDNGSDFEGNDNGFYIDCSDDDGLNSNDNGFGLHFLSQERMDEILNCANKFNAILNKLNIFKTKRNNETVDEEALLSPIQRHYSLYETDNVSSESDISTLANNLNNNINKSDENAKNTSNIRKHSVGYGTISSLNNSYDVVSVNNHDKILSFMYMSTMLISYLTSGLGMGLIFGIFGMCNQPENGIGKKPDITTGILMLIVIGLSCLLLSLMLSVGSICLIMCRYKNAPLWHHCFIWFGLIIIATTFVMAITLCF